MDIVKILQTEALEAGIRIGCTQAVRGMRGIITSIFPNPKAKSFLNSKIGQGLLSSVVGVGLGQTVGHKAAQSIAHECRVLGLARVGNGLVEHVVGQEPQENQD